MVPFGVFQNQSNILRRPFWCSVFLAFTQLMRQSAINGREFFQTRIHALYHSLVFSNLVLSWVLLLESPDLFPPRGLLQILAIPFSCYLSIWSFWYVLLVPYLALEMLCFLCICFFICLYAFSTNLLVKFSFVIWECPDLLVFCPDSVRVSSESAFFLEYHLIYFFQLYRQSCLRLYFFDGFIPFSPCVFFVP